MKSKLFFLSFFLILSVLVQAKLTVASILGDNMVLQRNTEVKIWGNTDPNQKVTVKADWNNVKVNVTSDEQGKWLVKVKTTEAGGPYSISISSGKDKVLIKNILLGEVWLCSGQSNMEMPVAGWSDMPTIGSNDFILDADNTNIRLFTLKKASMETPQDTCVGNWAVASSATVAPFTAVGYLFAKQLQRKLNVPVGVISSNWGGSRVEAWMNKETIAKFPEALKQTTQEKTSPNHKASRLYNGMIAPITNFAIKGVLWYQGESNKGNYYDYAALQASMVANWRTDFGVGEFPFYFVQIAPYSYGKSKGFDSALQRDEQLKSMSLIPNSGMISTLDIGEEFNIHPAQKETVAKRLAYWAFAKTYDVKNIIYKSPTFKSLTIKDSIVTISFNDAENGLSTFGKEVECFEVAGQDSVFYPAKMSITKKQVRVTSPQVKAPVAVRYGFSNFPKTEGYLYNTAGLPVPSFRSENWLK
jgi:sialate O-acetylesterase